MIKDNGMPAIINHVKCKSCQACKQVCPFDAIQWDQYNAVPIVNDDCMECGACIYACPADAIEITTTVNDTR